MVTNMETFSFIPYCCSQYQFYSLSFYSTDARMDDFRGELIDHYATEQ
jgi:hypothetical protein